MEAASITDTVSLAVKDTAAERTDHEYADVREKPTELVTVAPRVFSVDIGGGKTRLKYECTICGAMFKHSWNCVSHMKAHARRKKELKCRVCGKACSKQSELNIHMRIHTNDKPYRCTTCDKRFVRRSQLRQHLVVHTGERAYLCPLCPASFSVSSNLRRHVRLHQSGHVRQAGGRRAHVVTDRVESVVGNNISSQVAAVEKNPPSPAVSVLKSAASPVISVQKTASSLLLLETSPSQASSSQAGSASPQKHFSSQSVSLLKTSQPQVISLLKSSPLEGTSSARTQSHNHVSRCLKSIAIHDRDSEDTTSLLTKPIAQAHAGVQTISLLQNGLSVRAEQDGTSTSHVVQKSIGVQFDSEVHSAGETSQSAGRVIKLESTVDGTPDLNAEIQEGSMVNSIEHAPAVNPGTEQSQTSSGSETASVQDPPPVIPTDLSALIEGLEDASAAQQNGTSKCALLEPHQAAEGHLLSTVTPSIEQNAVSTVVGASEEQPQNTMAVTVSIPSSAGEKSFTFPVEHTPTTETVSAGGMKTETNSGLIQVDLSSLLSQLQQQQQLSSEQVINIKVDDGAPVTVLLDNACSAEVQIIDNTASGVTTLSDTSTQPHGASDGIVSEEDKTASIIDIDQFIQSITGQYNSNKKSPKGKPWECDICKKEFSREWYLTVHRQAHFKQQSFPCDQCGATFPRLSGLNRHMLVHTGEKPHECPKCQARFATKYRLHEHLRRHDRIKLYKCPACNSSFTDSSSLKRHQRTHEGDNLSHVCETCGVGFSTSHSLTTHLKVHSEVKGGDLGEGVILDTEQTTALDVMVVPKEKLGTADAPSTPCVISQVDADDRSVSYSCSVCGKLFKFAAACRQHVMHHMGSRPFRCSQCNASFARKADAKRHTVIHTQGKRHRCGECSKTFPTKVKLIVHEDEHVNESEKTQKCLRCDLKFSALKVLRMHERLHDKQKDPRRLRNSEGEDEEPTVSGDGQDKCADTTEKHVKGRRNNKSAAQKLKGVWNTQSGAQKIKDVQNTENEQGKQKQTFRVKIDAKEGSVGSADGEKQEAVAKRKRKNVSSDDKAVSEVSSDSCLDMPAEKAGVSRHEPDSELLTTSEPLSPNESLTTNESLATNESHALEGRRRPMRKAARNVQKLIASLTKPDHDKTQEESETEIEDQPPTGSSAANTQKKAVSVSTKERRSDSSSDSSPRKRTKYNKVQSPSKDSVPKASGQEAVKDLMSAVCLQQLEEIQKSLADQGVIFRCSVCKKPFNSKQELTEHLKSHYQCETCGLAYQYLGELDAHRRTHTGEKPYKCEVCDQAFAKRTVLKTHLRKHGLSDTLKCEHCGKVFRSNDMLNAHVQLCAKQAEQTT